MISRISNRACQLKLGKVHGVNSVIVVVGLEFR